MISFFYSKIYSPDIELVLIETQEQVSESLSKLQLQSDSIHFLSCA